MVEPLDSSDSSSAVPSAEVHPAHRYLCNPHLDQANSVSVFIKLSYHSATPSLRESEGVVNTFSFSLGGTFAFSVI